MLVDNDTFLGKLTSLFEERKGSIWLTHKRLTYTTDEPSSSTDRDYPCLIRATNGHEIKFSTQITSAQLPTFHSHYSALLKAQLSLGLRKRDKKREKQKSEELAKRKKARAAPLVLDPPRVSVDSNGKPIGNVSKRGAGRRRRQRIVKMLVSREKRQSERRARAPPVVITAERD